MSVEVKIPEIGESVKEGVIVEWKQKDGAYVDTDDPLFELETDKVNMDIAAEAAGRLSIEVEEGETVEVGQVVAHIDTDAERKEDEEKESGAEPAKKAEDEAKKAKEDKGDESGEAEGKEPRRPERPPQTEGPPLAAPSGMEQARAKLDDETKRRLSPAARRVVEEFGLDARKIEGTGRDGRITKEDALKAADEQGEGAEGEAPSKEEKKAGAPAKESKPAREKKAAPPEEREDEEARQTRRRMTPIRHRIAERMLEAQRSAAILTTFNEADLSSVIDVRNQLKEPFAEKYGVKLGFMSFFVKAAVSALKTVPAVNAQIDGDEIVTNHFYDIGVAIGAEHGLVVPVIRDADRLGFGEIEQIVADFAERAKSRKLDLSELTGGCFTITNGGVYGSMLSTPILNPPQSGILGMHAIKKRPMVVDDRIEIRPMMYVALSYDHRIVDGREAVAFLKHIVNCIEAPETLIMETMLED